MEDNKKDLKEYYIIYFDILGYKQYFEENKDHQQLLHDIIKLLKDVKDRANVYADIIKKETKIRAFSDNIIICVEATEKTSDHVGLLGYIVANMQTVIFAKYGLLVRGAYTKGKFYINNSIVYGEGLIKAVSLENEAKYPRIVIDSAVIKIPEWENNEHKIFRQDVDDKCFLNYFYNPHIDSVFDQFKEKLQKKIKNEGKYPSNIKDEKKINEKESIIQKTLWVVEKFNDACDAIGKPEEKIDYRVTINKRLLKMELSLAEKA